MMQPSEDVEFERFRRMGKAVATLYDSLTSQPYGVPADVAGEVVKMGLHIGFFNDYGGDTYRAHLGRQDAQLQLQQEQVALMRQAVAHMAALVDSQRDAPE